MTDWWNGETEGSDGELITPVDTPLEMEEPLKPLEISSVEESVGESVVEESNLEGLGVESGVDVSDLESSDEGGV